MTDEFDRLLVDILRPHIESIVDSFYATMLADPEASTFLDHHRVSQHLKPALGAWLLDTLAEHNAEQNESFHQRQVRIGEVHSRINVPMRIVNHGMALVKQQCHTHLQNSDTSRSQLAELLNRLHRRLDHAMGLINETYLHGAMDHDRQNQSLRLQLIDNNLAVECERLRSGVFDWMRRNILQLLHGEQTGEINPEPLSRSELGRWMTHKADLLFPHMELMSKLKAEIKRIDEQLEELIRTHTDPQREGFRQTMAALDQSVSDISWMLTNLTEHVLDNERCRDPLTRVLNRRFMTATLQREVRISQETRSPFALLMVDVDHFKLVNDTHGHDAGDIVLSETAELIMASARTTDFVFRYGGEEFLVIFSGASQATTLEIAERIRKRVSDHQFLIPGQPHIRVTVSVGAALFSGHPDYQQLLNQADQALFQAKREGRNRCVLFQSSID